MWHPLYQSIPLVFIQLFQKPKVAYKSMDILFDLFQSPVLKINKNPIGLKPATNCSNLDGDNVR